MATIQQLMPYLEQGYIAYDHVRRAYLEPKKQGDALVFEWKAYEMEGERSGPDIHTLEYVLAWKSDRWGILYRRAIVQRKGILFQLRQTEKD